MRVRVGEHEIEGTAEEVAKLLGLLGTATGVMVSPAVDSKVASASKDVSPFISEELAYDALTRRTLGMTHSKLLEVLYHAGDNWTPAPALQAKLGLTTREFAGLLGAFGKRLSHTDGSGSRTFFDQYWDHENGYNLYRLPPSVRAAVERARIAP